MKLELHTERLLLTPLAATDLDLAVELWTDPEVVEYVCDVVTEEEIRQEMPDATKRGGNGGRDMRQKYASACCSLRFRKSR